MPRLLLFVFNYTLLQLSTERMVAVKGDVLFLPHQHSLQPSSGARAVPHPGGEQAKDRRRKTAAAAMRSVKDRGS
jgi:hypothetical protein